MPEFLIYPIYTGILGLLLFILVPRNEIRRLLIYGIAFGGAVDALLIITLSNIIELGKYLNYEPFGYKGMPLFPIIAWSAYFTIFLYLLPQNKVLKYIFIALSALYSTLFANILVNLGIFKINYHRLLVPLPIYLLWHYAVAWAYLRLKVIIEPRD